MRLLVLLLAMLCGCSAADFRAAAEPPQSAFFTFQSNFWVNLHHFLRLVARGEPAPGQLSADERRVWDEALAVYREKYINRDLLQDAGMVAIKDTLRAAGNDQSLPDIPGEPDLKAALQKVAPVYRKYWWPAHDTMNQSWIAAVQPLLARYGARLSRDVPKAYGEQWPSRPMPVDLSVTAGPVGAYTSSPPHTTIASTDPGYYGRNALEMVFHETSHQWGKRIFLAIQEAAEAQKRNVPPQLWHAVLFHTSGELTRRALRDDGVPKYVEYAAQGDLYKSLCGDGCRERISKHWGPYLDGKIGFKTAIEQIVAEWPAAP